MPMTTRCNPSCSVAIGPWPGSAPRANSGHTRIGLIADLMFTRVQEEGIDDADGANVSAHRLRLGFQLDDRTVTDRGNLVGGTLHAAYRESFGGVGNDHGLELGGGLNLHTLGGLLLGLNGRTLLLNDDTEDWGLAAHIGWQTASNGQGFALSFTPSWGTAVGGGYGSGFGARWGHWRRLWCWQWLWQQLWRGQQ